MKNIKISLDFKADNKSHVKDLHAALGKLNLLSPEKKMATSRINDETVKAIKKIQKENQLPANGDLNSKTIEAFNSELMHQFVVGNKYRTTKIHSLFKKLNVSIDDEDIINRKIGTSSMNASRKIQKRNNFQVTGIAERRTIKALQNAFRDTNQSKRFSFIRSIKSMDKTENFDCKTFEKNKIPCQ